MANAPAVALKPKAEASLVVIDCVLSLLFPSSPPALALAYNVADWPQTPDSPTSREF